MSAGQVGLAGTVYLLGEVAGALIFGRLTDTLGRKKMFTLTLAIYLVGAAAAGLAPTMEVFLVCRFISGMGIGGEYSAINSAIDELIPGKHRGRVDLAINGTYWAGAALGALASSFLLDTARFPVDIGWRIAFFIGPVLGLGIIFLRRYIPESPRWLLTHGRAEEAEVIVSAIEQKVQEDGHQLPHHDDSDARWIKEGKGPERQAAGVRLLQALPDPDGPRRHPDGHPELPVQRHLLHLRPGPEELLRSQCFPGSALLLPLRDRQPSRSPAAGAVVRHRGATQDDRGLLRDQWHRAGHLGGSVPGRRAHGRDPHGLLVPCVLLCLGRGLRRLPDRFGDLPPGSPGPGDLVLLLHRPARRCVGPGALRRPDRGRHGSEPDVLGLPPGHGSHALRRPGGGRLGRRRRGQVAGGDRSAPDRVRRGREPKDPSRLSDPAQR